MHPYAFGLNAHPSTPMPRAKPPVSSDDDAPLVVQPPPVIPPKRPPRYSKFSEMMAKEGREGHTASEGSASEDDRDQPDMSYIVSDASQEVDDAMRNIYAASLTSQGAVMGFGVPIGQQRADEEERGHGSIVQGVIDRQIRKDARREARKAARVTVPPVPDASSPQQRRKTARRDADRVSRNAIPPNPTPVPIASSPKQLPAFAPSAFIVSPPKQLPDPKHPMNSLVPHERQFVSRMKLKAKPSTLQHSFPEPFHVIHHVSPHVPPLKSLLSHRGGGLAASFEEACHVHGHVSPHVSPAKSLLLQRGGLAVSFDEAGHAYQNLSHHLSPPKSLMSQGGGDLAASFDEACHVLRRLSPQLSPTKSSLSQLGGPADSPVSRFEAWKHAVKQKPGIYGCTVATQTTFHHEPAGHLDSAVQTSLQQPADPLTLQDLRTELRAFLIGIGF